MTDEDDLYVAVDLGAGSGRVFLVGVAPGELLIEEVRRFHYPPRRADGHLRWNFGEIFAQIKTGLRAAGERARRLKRKIKSIGVDSWAVDYGLIDDAKRLLEDPVCYRDERTDGVMDEVFAIVPKGEIYERTGIQFLAFNTLYQLYSHQRSGLPSGARRLLLIPDLINFFLTDRAVAEYTNATTTQLLDARRRTWDLELAAALKVPGELLPKVVPAGTDLGPLRPSLAEELNLASEVRVIATATHDTASAVAGAPLIEGWAYISSGTWSLIGVERGAEALINREAARSNFTNEGGAFGTTRFLKNVMGLWILERCREEWKARGDAVDYETLLDQIDGREDFPALIYPDDARFFNPPSMLRALNEQLAETDQKVVPADPPAITKIILDSLALRYASVQREIEKLDGKKIEAVVIVGGGSRNEYLNRATATATNLPVRGGPAEATVIGNAMVQAIAAKRFASLDESRRHTAAQLSMKLFTPRRPPAWDDAIRRYQEIEKRYE